MGMPKKINILFSFIARPGGLLVVGALMSVFVGLFMATPAYAADATWKNDTTIIYETKEYTGPKVTNSVQPFAGMPQKAIYFTNTSNSCKIIFFGANTNLNTETEARFIDGKKESNDKCSYPAAKAITIDARDGSNPGSGSNTGGSGNQDANETCNITGIGWIVCPVAVFLAGVTDAAYALIENLLIFSFADNALDTNNPVYNIWSNVRNLANIAFIFAFFAIIFSQATSIGIGSYGIKKMLPRLIVAAIMVNLSYFMCVLAIDISNIVGAGIDGIIRSVPLEGGAGTSSDPATGASTWTGIIIPLLAGGAIVGGVAAAGGILGALAAALPFLVIALFAILTALVVLVARQAILILLIIIAPLAFVAYILPNTEDWFNKWRKIFTTLLIFYPLVAILFAGSSVAASILRITSNSGGFDEQLIKVMSLAVAAFPLFGLPFLLKFSGGLLGRIGGMVNNPNKGPFDKLRKNAEQRRDTTQARGRARALNKGDVDYTGKRFGKSRTSARRALNKTPFTVAGSARSEIDREKALESAKQAQSKVSGEYYTGRIVNDDAYASRMAGATRFNEADSVALHQVKTSALAAEKKAFNDRVASYQLSYSLDPKGADTGAGRDKDGKVIRDAQNRTAQPSYLEQQFTEAITTNNLEQASATLNRMSNLGVGGREAVRRALQDNQVLNTDMKQTINNSIYEDNYGSLVSKVGDVAKGGFGADGKWNTKETIRKVGSEQLATQDLPTLKEVELEIIPEEAYRIVHDQELRSKVVDTDALKLFEKVAQKYSPPASPTPTPSGPTLPPPTPAGP